MTDWSFLGSLFSSLQAHSPMLGRLWLLLMLVFRMLVLSTVGSDVFDDEQEEFSCNTQQPGCKQACYDQAFPISHYRFWVFHIVLISTPALVFLVYAMHRSKKHQTSGDGQQKRLYALSVSFRLLSELGFLLCQWLLYGFQVDARFTCSRFPCPHTVDCFTSRPTEKTIFLLFYFSVGVVSALASLAELAHVAHKRYAARHRWAVKELQGETQENLSPREGPRVTVERGAAVARGVTLPCPRRWRSGRWKEVRTGVGMKGKVVVRYNSDTKRSRIRLKQIRRSKSQKSALLMV